ncbi:hypothetical protein ACF059_17695 [Streptomyces sp. NPDC016562]|uniref:hypothetical protein n=1 Tax=Streptomyces sp. NPDC016562 TaxID=3364966 RepID=UPI0036F98C4C
MDDEPSAGPARLTPWGIDRTPVAKRHTRRPLSLLLEGTLLLRPSRATVLLTAGLTFLLGMPAAAAAAAETPSPLYVNHAADANCSDSGPGSPDAPFCTISTAAQRVLPGQTVHILSGTP